MNNRWMLGNSAHFRRLSQEDLSNLEASGAKGATARKEVAATYLRQELYPAVSVPSKAEESAKQRGPQKSQELLPTTQQEVDAATISAGKRHR